MILSGSGAVFSKCQKYRYALWRRTGGSMAPVLFIMLNPSTADGSKDDPTIRRCIQFAKDWDHSYMIVVNLFAYRSTDPKKLKKVQDPEGPDNSMWINKMAKVSCLVMAAWGANGSLHEQDKHVMSMVDTSWTQVKALGFTKSGLPRHPLYMPKNPKLHSYSMKPTK